MNNITVDEQDKDLLSEYEWSFNNKGYVRTRNRINGVQLYLHKLIAVRMGLSGNIDHRDSNPLNNSRSNLRSCTQQQNMANRGMNRNNTSGYKGVSFDKRRKANPWKASISNNNKIKCIGCFSTPEQAALAYDTAAIQLRGEYAKTNAMLGLL